MQEVHKNYFNENIEEVMDYEEDHYIDDPFPPLIPDYIVPSTSSAPIPPISNKTTDKIFNEEKFSKINKLKIIKIKEKLLKSFLNKSKIQNINQSNINYNSLKNMLDHLKIYEDNILKTNKKSIFYYTMLGKIFYHIKVMFPTNWKIILKDNKINYVPQFLNFLINLFHLFHNNKKLYQSTLSMSFFKTNFPIIEEIVKNGI